MVFSSLMLALVPLSHDRVREFVDLCHSPGGCPLAVLIDQ
jgi:hypothetical protein